MRRIQGLLIAISFMLANSTIAFGQTYNDYWKEAHHPGVEVKDYPKETVVTDVKNLTTYIFTKPNNPAHPGVIIRKMVSGKDGTHMDTLGYSGGPDSAQDVFKAWMNNPLQ